MQRNGSLISCLTEAGIFVVNRGIFEKVWEVTISVNKMRKVMCQEIFLVLIIFVFVGSISKTNLIIRSG